MEAELPILLAVGIALGVTANLAPGPGIRLTVRGASFRGPLAAFDGWAGGAFVDLLLLCGVLVVCLPSLADLTPGTGLRWCIRIVGGGALVGAGWDLMERRAQGVLYRETETPVGAGRVGGRAAFVTRVAGAATSPLGLAVKASAGAAMLFGFGGASVGGAAILAAGFFAGGLLTHALIALRIGRHRGFRALSDRQYSVVASLGGLFLVGVGLVTAASAVGESGLPDTLSRMIDGLFG